MILEPIWSNYLAESPLYWSKAFDQTNPLFSLQFMNPIFFLGTAALVAYGSWAKQLNRYESLSSALLLIIPYISKGYDNGMVGHARYALIVVPAFWVLGGLLHETPREVQFCVIAVSAAYMTLFATLFAAWRVII